MKLLVILFFLVSLNSWAQQGTGNGGPGITLRQLNDFDVIRDRIGRGEIIFGGRDAFVNFGNVVDLNTARFGVQDRDSFIDTHRDSAIVIDDSLYVDPKKVEVIDYQTRDGAFIYDPELFGIEDDD